MAGRFRFTPMCCCTPSEEANACIPDCTVIADRVVTNEEESSLPALVIAARHCPNETFWHGFTVDASSPYYARPLTTDYKSGVLPGRANSQIFVVGYSQGTRRGPFYSSSAALESVDAAQVSTNTDADYTNYLITTDTVDHKIHYRSSVTEPAWLLIVSLPYDDPPFAFDCEDTAASYAAASPVRLSVTPTYLSVADCGGEVRQVDADFATDAEAWSQYHTGDSSAYAIDASALDSWVTSLADGTHHYGSDRFFVLRAGARLNRWSYNSQTQQYTTGYPEAYAEVVEGRFQPDKPTFTPMFAGGVYTADNESVVDINRQPTTLSEAFGSAASLPTEWQVAPQMADNRFFGTYFVLACGVSHRTLPYPSPTARALNQFFPLGRYRYTPRTSQTNDYPFANYLTGPAYLAEATLDAAVENWDFSDWMEFRNCQGQIWTWNPFDVRVCPRRAPAKWAAWWYRPEYYVYTANQNTPAELKSGNLAYGRRTSFVNKIATLSTGEAPLGFLTGDIPSRGSDVVDANSARVSGLDITSRNLFRKIIPIASTYVVEVPEGVGEEAGPRYVPNVGAAARNAIVPGSLYVDTPPVADQTGKEFVIYPLVRVSYVWADL